MAEAERQSEWATLAVLFQTLKEFSHASGFGKISKSQFLAFESQRAFHPALDGLYVS
jgi:hypothetical protein